MLFQIERDTQQAGAPSGTGTSVSNLSSGSYTVTVTDSKGCTATKAFSVTQPTSLPSATVTPTAVSCFGGTNGAASVSGSGGTTGYTFAWTGGATGTFCFEFKQRKLYRYCY
jgi:hypothetical protein